MLSACLNEFDKMLFLYTSSCRLLTFAVETENGGEATRLIRATEPQSQLASTSVVQMDFIQECEGVVICFASGSMFQVKDKTWEEVGELGDGILTGCWAPNQEYFAVATGAGNLIVFTPEFDVLYEAKIDDDDLTFKADDQVKNCQIRDAQISWRGDSSIFVVNYSINGGRKCLTRDMQRGLQVAKGPARADNQVVFSVSEAPVETLELPISFMPNGSLVAGFQRRVLPNGQLNPEIIFWERNGLRHGEFDLPKAKEPAKTDIFKLSFNLESTVLAIHCTIDD